MLPDCIQPIHTPSMTHLLDSRRNPGGRSLSRSTSSPSSTSNPRLGTVSAFTVCPAQMLFEPTDEGAPVMTIAPDQFEPGKCLFQRREQGFRSLLVGPIGGEYFDGQQMALRINQDKSYNRFSPVSSLVFEAKRT
jgi:hypothetical protein